VLEKTGLIAFVLFVIAYIPLSYSAPALTQTKSPSEKTVIDDQVTNRQAAEQYPAIVNLYRPNYVLPYYYTGLPYQTIYVDQTPNDQIVKHEELKAQLSFLVPIFHHLF
jgi:phospholipase A1